MPTEPILITIPDAARAYKCSRSTIYQLIWRGMLPVVKLGPGQSGAVRLRLSDLEDLAASSATFRRRGRTGRNTKETAGSGKTRQKKSPAGGSAGRLEARGSLDK